MNFTYFENPEKYTGLRDHITACHFCEEEKACFEAEAFYGEDSIDSICPQCLLDGRLLEIDSTTCNGDIEDLKRQLKELHPSLGNSEVQQIAADRTTALEKTTPPLITWQDWEWPALDGDYGKFIGYGSKELYKRLARGASAQQFFEDSIRNEDEEIDTEYLWDEVITDTEIKDYTESAEQETLFYIFKSLTSDKIVTIMDTA